LEKFGKSRGSRKPSVHHGDLNPNRAAIFDKNRRFSCIEWRPASISRANAGQNLPRKAVVILW